MFFKFKLYRRLLKGYVNSISGHPSSIFSRKGVLFCCILIVLILGGDPDDFKSTILSYLKIICYDKYAKSKTYSICIKSMEHSEQKKFQESEYFKEKARERYKIEAKNSELKHRHGYDVASTSGLVGMQMQGAMAIFTVNLKRILTLLK
jgi:hypothetical protein